MSEWINVKERLPEKYKNVLVFDESGDIYKASWADLGCPVYWTDYSDNAHEETITHWMPLPEPPKE